MKNIILLIATGFVLAGCSGARDEGPKADASVSIDLGKEADKMGAAMEKAGDKLKEGAAATQEKLEDAGAALKKNAEEMKDKLTSDKKVEVEVKTK
jgi:hypothetical protein